MTVRQFDVITRKCGMAILPAAYVCVSDCVPVMHQLLKVYMQCVGTPTEYLVQACI